MINQDILSSSRARTVFTVAVLCILAGLMGVLIADSQINYRSVIAVIIALAGLFVVTRGERTVQVGFIILIISLALGFRTLPAGAYIRIHPSEILLWVLLLVLAMTSIFQRSKLERGSTPKWLWLMIPFWFWAWLPGISAGRPWDLMFSEFRNFLLLLPLFLVAAQALKESTQWRTVILAFFGVGSWVALMGDLEYFFPGIRDLLPGFIAVAGSVTTGEGFERGLFAFWGSPDAVFIVSLALPMAIVLWRWASSLKRGLLLVLVALQIMALYIGGHRDTWVLLLVQFALWAILEGRLIRTVPLLVILAGFVIFIPSIIPSGALSRAETIVQIASGLTPDSSSFHREQRASAALDLIGQNPMGNGWGASGWVHSDFLQVGANLGLVPGLLFLAACLLTGLQLYARIRDPRLPEESGALGVGLLLSFVAVVGLLTFETVIVLPQLVLPVWFVWVIAEIWLQQTHNTYLQSNVPSTSLRPAADV